MPERLRLSRRRGYRKPAGVITVARPTFWGNPYRIVAVRKSGPFDVEHTEYGFVAQTTGRDLASDIAIARFRTDTLQALKYDPTCLDALRGRDLACWCALDKPCHADVLLELANATTPDHA